MVSIRNANRSLIWNSKLSSGTNTEKYSEIGTAPDLDRVWVETGWVGTGWVVTGWVETGWFETGWVWTGWIGTVSCRVVSVVLKLRIWFISLISSRFQSLHISTDSPKLLKSCRIHQKRLNWFALVKTYSTSAINQKHLIQAYIQFLSLSLNIRTFLVMTDKASPELFLEFHTL